MKALVLFAATALSVTLAAPATAQDHAGHATPAPAEPEVDHATMDHSHGLETHVWTVNGGQEMRRAVSWGVDGIITNYPQVLDDILSRG